jgi:hypothetical protein
VAQWESRLCGKMELPGVLAVLEGVGNAKADGDL